MEAEAQVMKGQPSSSLSSYTERARRATTSLAQLFFHNFNHTTWMGRDLDCEIQHPEYQ